MADAGWIKAIQAQTWAEQTWDVGSWKTQKMGDLPSGKHTKNYGKSPFLMGKSTITGHFQ